MYRVFVLLEFLLAFYLLPAQTSGHEDQNSVVIEFENTIFDFGKIEQGSEAICIFSFKNMGKEPLVLQNVKSSCGCTVPSWTKDPVSRKKRGEIKVQYDTRSVTAFTKTITIYSNAMNNPVILTIRGEVIPKKENLKTKAGIKKVEMTRENLEIDN